MNRMSLAVGGVIGAAALIGVGTAAAQTQSWSFEVFLNDTPIGHHHYFLRQSGAERELEIEAQFNVKFLFINAYRYAHDASERWRDNCLVALTAHTDDNGSKSKVDTEQQGERLAAVISSTPAASSVREPVDGCLMSFAYWNADMLRQTRLLNAQTGRIENVTITSLGEEKINVRGTLTPAIRYRVTGPKHPIDLWYDAGRAWLALQSTLEGGRRLRYQLR
jgi:Family of unknown function (DUF6134)